MEVDTRNKEHELTENTCIESKVIGNCRVVTPLIFGGVLHKLADQKGQHPYSRIIVVKVNNVDARLT